MAEYNGYTNYETWCVSLWLDNDEYIHNHLMADWVKEADRQAYHYSPALTHADSLVICLTDLIKDYVNDPDNGLRPDLGASMAEDMLGAAFDEVNWREIAENTLESNPIEEETEEESE